MILREKYTSKIEQYLKVTNSIFLIGARQVGKTSIMKSLTEHEIIPAKNSFYLNFDDIALSGNLKFDDIFSFIRYIEFTYNIIFVDIEYFLFDEVKNVRNFNLLLKSLIDTYPTKKFICTSSGNYEWTNEVIE